MHPIIFVGRAVTLKPNMFGFRQGAWIYFLFLMGPGPVLQIRLEFIFLII